MVIKDWELHLVGVVREKKGLAKAEGGPMQRTTCLK